MNDSNNILLDPTSAIVPVRLEQTGPLLMAGLREPLDESTAHKIPLLWRQLTSQWQSIKQRVGAEAYGLCIHLQGPSYYYMASCAVWDFAELPAEFSAFIIPSQAYAVFTHDGSVQSIRTTIGFAFDQWLPQSGYRHASPADNTLHFFERYGEQFDPHTGKGEIEIWLPISNAY